MYKASSRKIGIFLTGFILLAWAAIVPPSLGAAGLHELSDKEMAAVYAQGFSEFNLTGDTITLKFNDVTLSTWTEMTALRMGYYLKQLADPPYTPTLGWDQEWTSTGSPLGKVSLGTSAYDLEAQGLYIEAKFSDIGSATRQLQYVHIGTTKLTGDISANFNSFTGTIGGTPYNRANLGALGLKTITSNGDINSGFYLSLDRTGGYSFNFGSSSNIH